MAIAKTALLAGVLTAGCATAAHDAELRQIKSAVAGLEDRLGRAEARLTDVDNHVVVLQEAARDTSPTPTGLPTPLPVVALPRVLPVVPLSAEEFSGQLDERAAASQASDTLPTVQIVSDEQGELHTLPLTPTRRRASDTTRDAPFKKALALYQRGRMDEAFDHFARFVRRHPNVPEANDARFWMAECKFEARAYGDAVQYFTAATKGSPDGSKVATALFKMGLAYERLRDPHRAGDNFRALIARYPSSPTAELAQAHLKAARMTPKEAP